MTHTYQITGMTCSGCQAKVKSLLEQVPEIKNVDISLAEGTADITMASHVPTTILQHALAAYPKYQLTEAVVHQHATNNLEQTDGKSWFETYKPILLIAAYLLVIAIIAGKSTDNFNFLLAMRIFMSGFFLVFSFFKLLDLNGFADSYTMYDLVARKWRPYAYLYAFIELSLGILFALDVIPVTTGIITIIVMSVSLLGVLKSVLKKQQIRCACLGAVFNLPMSTVTIIEDALMIVMSGAMLFYM
jgi:copper chaperone CopZ